jgi:hypothetical protein
MPVCRTSPGFPRKPKLDSVIRGRRFYLGFSIRPDTHRSGTSASRFETTRPLDRPLLIRNEQSNRTKPPDKSGLRDQLRPSARKPGFESSPVPRVVVLLRAPTALPPSCEANVRFLSDSTASFPIRVAASGVPTHRVYPLGQSAFYRAGPGPQGKSNRWRKAQ